MRERSKADAVRRKTLKRGAARRLREDATEPERKLWALLRRKKIAALRFRRQQPIGPYIVDFFCASMKLIVELDGGQHGEDCAVVYDEARTRWLAENGYRVLRIWNWDFRENPDGVLDTIWRTAKESGRPLPETPCVSTLPQGEG